MNMTSRLVVGLVTGIFVWLGYTALAHAHEEDSDSTVSVHMYPDEYEPRNLSIPVNTTVIFENATADSYFWPASNIHPTHEIYSDFDPKEPVIPGQSWSFTFDQIGSWQYHDHINPRLTGTITVTGTADASSFASVIAAAQQWLRSGPLRPIIASLQPYDETIAVDSREVYHDEEALYSYIRRYGVSDTMDHLVSLSRELDSCHDPAHRVGRIAYELFGDRSFDQCSAACHSGCYHGATEVFFRDHGTENLKDNLDLLCSNRLNHFYMHQCLHGIGHGLMAWTNYDIHEALEGCDLLDRGQSSCYTGVFMENIVGSLGEGEAEGHFTNYLNDDPHFPCTVVAENYQAMCYFYQTSYMYRLFDYDFAKVAAACSEAPEQYQYYCFQSMGRDVGGAHRPQVEPAITICEAIENPAHRQYCLDGAVQDYFWEPEGRHHAVEFCRRLGDTDNKDSCYNIIISRAGEVLSTLEHKDDFCAAVEPSFREWCREVLF